LSTRRSRLNGSIPSQLGNLRVLADLDVNNNQLSGPMPLSLENLNLGTLATFYFDPTVCEPQGAPDVLESL
jgi:hypothetical protein